MNKPSESSLYKKFGKAFADAVLAYMATGQAHSVDYDDQLLDFVIGPVEPGTSPTDVGVWVGAQWGHLTGPLAAIENPADPEFSALDLHAEIRQAAQESPLLIKLALIAAGETISGELYDAQAATYRRQ